MSNNLIIFGLMVVAILSCCFNVILLELIIKEYSSSHSLITLSQFLFITLCTINKERLNPKVPIKEYLNLVILHFLVTLSGNLSLGFNISFPLFMIFKSSSLIANMILGILILKKEYKLKKYLSVIIITFGIILCTFASSKDFQNTENIENKNAFSDWLFGIFLLFFSVIGSAQTGIYQEKINSKYGRNTNESLFYCHALFLPGFLFMTPNILKTIDIFNNSKSINLFSPYFNFSKLWFYLLMNMLTQYFCAKSIFILSTYCTSLTITLLITLRKFFSLIISIFLFKNAFTLQHWIGTFFVFSGTLFFAEIDLFYLFNLYKHRIKKQN